MNIDKYGETNILGYDFNTIDYYTYKQFQIYTGFIGNVSKDAKIFEIGPGNGMFLYFLKNYYGFTYNNIITIDISKSVIDNLNQNDITKQFNNNIGDSIAFLSVNKYKFDLIIMRHVIEHMSKEYIEKLVPILLNSLKGGGKILIETPNLISIPFGIVLYYQDFSHQTGFTEKSLRECFIWNSINDLDIQFYNLYLHIIDTGSIFSLLKSSITIFIYKTYVMILLYIYKFVGLPFTVGTVSLVSVIRKK